MDNSYMNEGGRIHEQNIPYVCTGFVFFRSSIWAKCSKRTFRHRPPEMVVAENGTLSGPLKDIIEIAAKRLNYKLEWIVAPFARSLQELKTNTVDLVPRTLYTEDRAEFVYFLGPIGHNFSDILFLVKKGKENSIKKYEDLYNVRVGVKRGTVYFPQFDKDIKINKFDSTDDDNMSRMFVANRFDTMIILDKGAIESALEKINFKDYDYAEYKYPSKIDNFYGAPLKSDKSAVYSRLNIILSEMVKSGEIKKIYAQYGLEVLH